MGNQSRTKQEFIKELSFLREKITELEQCESEHKQTEKKCQNIIDNAIEGIFQTTPEGRYVSVNSALVRMYGYESPEDMMSSVTDVGKQLDVYPEQRKERLRLLDENRVLENYEAQMRRKDGSIFWVSVNARLVREDAGNPIYYEGFVTDITTRKRADEVLRESEEKFRTIFDMASDGVLIVDPITKKFLQGNTAICSMLGYTKEEIESLTVYDIHSPKDASHVLDEFEKLTNKEKVITEDIPLLRKDGAIIYADIGSTHIIIGGTHYLMGIIRDITDRKRMEEALRESEERFRLLVNALPDMVFTINEDLNILQVSQSVEKVLGCQPEELVGRNLMDLKILGPEYMGKASSDIRYVFQGNTAPLSVYELIHKDGEKRIVDISGTPLLKDGKVVAMISVIRDITDRIQAEDERKKLEKQLFQAQKMEAIGTLAGGIAHDFNNLLMIIQGNISLIMLDPSHPHHEDLKSVEIQIRSAADLTKQLLGFAQGGRYDVKPTDINEFVEKTASIFGRTKKGIRIQGKYGKDLWPVEVDTGQMEQVFMNLFINAWQAMPGGGDIFLETQNVVLEEDYVKPYDTVPGKYVNISVTDTGGGFDEKMKHRIFEPFFTTREMGRGTGLGLSMVYGIIRGHKGFINVDNSESGHGATFNIYLPASEQEVVPEVLIPAGIIRGAGIILVVDDEAAVLKISQRMLEHLGYKVIAAQNGKEAVALYQGRKDEIDIVLLDMIMPEMSGGKVYQILRDLNPGVKVILFSGYSIDGEAHAIMDRGCNGFLQKPFSLGELSQKIHEVLSMKNEG